MTAITEARPAPDPYRAALDVDYYVEERARLDGVAKDRFDAAVNAAYNPITDAEWRVLDFADQLPRIPGEREQAIRDTFGISATRYYQILNRLIDSTEAQARKPVLVKRLREQRANRQAQRSNPTTTTAARSAA